MVHIHTSEENWWRQKSQAYWTTPYSQENLKDSVWELAKTFWTSLRINYPLHQGFFFSGFAVRLWVHSIPHPPHPAPRREGGSLILEASKSPKVNRNFASTPCVVKATQPRNFWMCVSVCGFGYFKVTWFWEGSECG